MNLKKFIKSCIHTFGIDIVSLNKGSNQKALLAPRLANLKQLGFKPKFIIDGGAHTGGWTKIAARYFPEARYLLVEPNPMVAKKIKSSVSSELEFSVVQKALGAQEGTEVLNIWNATDRALTASSICHHVQGAPNTQLRCELTTLDALVKEHNQSADLVKLDLQGYELQALHGAMETLQQAEVFIIEFGCLEAYINRSAINAIFDVMYKNSYRLYDIVDLHYRPYDNALTGGDLIFIKKSSKLNEYKGWQ